MNKVTRTIAYNLKFIRQSHGLTQQQIADSICVSRKQIQRYEKNQSPISCAHLVSLAKLFKINYEDFLIGYQEDIINKNDDLDLLWRHFNCIKIHSLQAIKIIEKKGRKCKCKFIK